MKNVAVKTLEGKDAPLELLAQDIEAVARAGAAIMNSRLTKRSLVLLIQEQCRPKVSQNDIVAVLDAIPALQNALKPITKRKG